MNGKQYCGAKNRAGHPCRRAPMRNGRCNLHGGKSPGAKPGNTNALKHGGYSAETIRFRQLAREAVQDAKELDRLLRETIG